MADRKKYQHIEVLPLGALLLAGFIYFGTGFGPYWDSWLFYNRAMPWSHLVESIGSDTPAPPLWDTAQYFPDARRHPPFMEIGGGICNALFSHWLGELGSCRLFVELFTVFWLCASYVYLKNRLGWIAGLLGVCLFLGSPRFLVHGARFGIDGLIGVLYGLAVLSFFKWNTGSLGRALIFILLAISFYTKIQGLYLIPLFFLWIAWEQLSERDKPLASRLHGLNVQMEPALALVFTALALAALMWVPLWRDYPKGIREYLDFNFKHIAISVMYFGVKYGEYDQPAPWHYPFGMSLAALPLGLTLPIVIRALRKLCRLALPGRGPVIERAYSQEEPMLWAAMLLPLAVSAMPGVPRFDGVRLLLPAYGPMILLAAFEISEWFGTVRRWLPGMMRPVVQTAFLAASLLLLMPSIRIYPFNLCYYSPVIGGIRGAEKIGFDLDYLGVSMHLLNPALNKAAREGDYLLVRGGNSLVYMPGREGWTAIPKGIKVGRFAVEPALTSLPGGVFVCLGSRYSDETWEDRKILADLEPVDEVRYEGVRIFSLYKLEKEFIHTLLEEQFERNKQRHAPMGSRP